MPLKRPVGRPRKATTASTKTKKAPAKRAKRLTEKEKGHIEDSRFVYTPSLVIVKGEGGLPGDREFFDSVKAKCNTLYGDKLAILETDMDPSSDAEEEDEAEDAEAEENGVDDEGRSDEGRSDDGAIMQIQEDPPYDPEMIEMWIETQGGVLRLISRRAKNPLKMTTELECEVMEGIAEYMHPEHHLTFESFRDESNQPELS